MIKLILIITLIVQAYLQKQLLFVQSIFRHGSRFPVYKSLNDGAASLYHPNQLGILTKKGKEGQYQLGVKFRQKYWQKLNISQDKQEQIICFSSNVNRTIQSLYFNLLGLYNYTKSDYYQQFNKFISAKILIKKKLNVIEFPFFGQCRNVDYWTESILKSNKIYNAFKKNKKFIQLIQAIQKNNLVTNPLQDYDIMILFDNYNVAKTIGYPYHSIFDTSIKKQISIPSYIYLAFFSTLFFFVKYGSHQLQRNTSMTPFINQLLQNFLNKISSQSKNKLILYSGHQINLVLLMSLLGVTTPECLYQHYLQQNEDLDYCITQYPSFNAFISFQLFKQQSRYFIKILYQNQYIKMPFCNYSQECEFNTFFQFMKSSIIQNFIEVCGNRQIYQEL